MSARSDAERLIWGMLCQLWLDQQIQHCMDESERHRRFGAAMTALAKLHSTGRCRGLPLLQPDNDGYFFEFDRVLFAAKVQGEIIVAGQVFRIVLAPGQATDRLSCFRPEERFGLEWLAGVYADPSQAEQSVS